MIIPMATQAMGTRFELALVGESETDLRAVGERAIEEIEDWDQRLSRFRRDSLVSLINRDAATRAVRLDDDLLDLLQLAFDVFTQSRGAFDLTVGSLMSASGFRDGEGDSDLGDALSRTGMSHVDVDWVAGTVRFTQPGIELDFGAIGKGFALDMAARIVRESQAVHASLMHGGTSTVTASGSSPAGADGWPIQIRDPRDGSDHPVVLLRDESLSVSAPHGRSIERDGATQGHVLDPRTGRSAADSSYAAVIGPSATLADAWSTALLVLGQRATALDSTYASLIDGRLEPPDCRNVEWSAVSSRIASSE